MPLLNSIATWWIRKRMHQIELFKKYPHEVQLEWLKKIVYNAKNTEWGMQYQFNTIETVKDFTNRIPLQDYNSLKIHIDRMRHGEQNILWPGETKWFAKSSGTTENKSKYLPISNESLEECHYNGGRDMVAIYCENFPDTHLFTGKNLALAGSLDTDHFDKHESYSGDLSAIVINNLPIWAEYLRAPELSLALIKNWDEKLSKIAASVSKQDITSIAGVPSWMLILLNEVLKISEKKSISEVWPNLEVFFHGGVNFSPYKALFKTVFNSDKIKYLELYNASEGFFGIQDQNNSNDLLLMLDYGIYYEFIPSGNPTKVVQLDEINLYENYAVVITTTAGLWRYQLGDTIMFTSKFPYRFKITGRTKLFINAFGEELIIDNAEQALAIACEKTGALISEYTAGPVYMSSNNSGAHEWIIEFGKEPDSLDYFSEILDNALKSLNSDYEAKRYHNYTLKPPVITKVKKGTFLKFLENKGKLGGQNKIPRLSNDRKIIEEITTLINE